MAKKLKIKKQNLIILVAVVIAFFILVGFLISNFLKIQGNPENKTYCTLENRGVEVCTEEYSPVCGWFNKSIQCFKYPCAQTYSNACSACINSMVEFHTPGECPK